VSGMSLPTGEMNYRFLAPPLSFKPDDWEEFDDLEEIEVIRQGTLAQFIAFMQRENQRHPDPLYFPYRWNTAMRELEASESSAIWLVTIGNFEDHLVGRICAIELPGRIRVVFQLLEQESLTLTKTFWGRLVPNLLMEMYKLGFTEPTNDSSSDMGTDRPNWFPKTPQTREKWRRAYRILDGLREQYRQYYLDGETDSPKPTFGDYKTALLEKGMGENWGQRTLRNILRAGDMGLLK